MKKWKKICLIAALASLIVLLVAGLVVLRLSLESIIKMGVESVGSKALGVKVELKDIDLSLLSGEATIKGFKMHNPPGYSSPQAFEVALVHVDIAPLSLLGSKTHIEDITIDGVSASFEQGLPESNISKIAANLEAFKKAKDVADKSSGGQPDVKAEQGESSDDAKPERQTSNEQPGNEQPAKQQPTKSGNRKLQVDNLSIKNVKVSFSAKGTGASGTLSAPGVELHDLGKGPEGIQASELVIEVMNSFLQSIIGSARQFGIGGILGGAQDKAKDIGSEIQSGGEKAAEGVKDAVDGVIGIFK